MKVLVTGFEPFGALSVNSSWEAVRNLPDKIDGKDIIKMRLPVVFGEAAQRANAYAKEINAEAIILTGMAESYKAVTIERVAINLRDARLPDNSGRQPRDEKISSDGENAYFSTLPVKKICEKIKGENITCDISYSAGTYVCNDLFYSVLHENRNTSVKVGFFHLPRIDNDSGVSQEDMTKALEIAVREL